MRELSAIENFLGDGNAVRSGKDSINVVIRGPLATVVVQFKFRKNYPNSPVDFEIIDSGDLPESQVSQLQTKIKQHLETTRGLPTLLALVIQIRFMLETGVPVQAPPSPFSVRRSSSVVRSLSSMATLSDPRRDHYLVYFFHKAAGSRDDRDESECLESCLESLKALGLIGDDETSDVYHAAFPEMVKHMNACLPQQVRDILTDGDVAAPTSSKEERARFFKLFDVADSLGRGGYGSVIKAKYKFDEQVYAVKCIPIGTDESKDDLKRECKILSLIDNRYVVRYYASWIDELTDEDAKELREVFHFEDEDEMMDFSTTMSRTRTRKFDYWDDDQERLGSGSGSGDGEMDEFDSGGDDVITFGPASLSFSEETPELRLSYGEFGCSPGQVVLEFSNEPTEEEQEEEEEEEEEEEGQEGLGKRCRMGNKFLFIQMEYCSGRSLDELFHDDAFFKDPVKQWTITRQVLEGLQYLHSQGIIHRDMKPSNIFIDEHGNAKIGDFGLSKISATKSLQRFENSTLLQEEASHGIAGSFPYTAPEILNGADYDTSSDMYSMGIILFEIWCQFSTMLERARILRALVDESQVPAGWQEQHQQISALVQRLLKSAPEKRPSARDILMGGYIPQINVELSTEDISDLIHAISSGDIRKSETAMQVLDALFSETRRHKFSTDEMPKITVQEFYEKSAIHEAVIGTFSELVRLYGASMYSSPMLEPYTLDQECGMPVMTRNGDLSVMKSSPWHYMTKEILKSNLEFARYGQVGLVVDNFQQDKQTQVMMIYNVVKNYHNPESWTEVLECVQFGSEYIRRVDEQAKIEIVVSHSELARDVCHQTDTNVPWKEIEQYCLGNKANFAQQLALEGLEAAPLNAIPNTLDGQEVTSDFVQAIDRLHLGDEVRFKLFGSTVPYYDGLSCEVFANGKSIATVGLVKNTNFQVLQKLDPRLMKRKEPAIIACQINFVQAMTLGTGKPRYLMSIMLIQTPRSFDGNTDMFLTSRPVYATEEWNEMNRRLRTLVRLLRQAQVIVKIAPNDGKAYLDIVKDVAGQVEVCGIVCSSGKSANKDGEEKSLNSFSIQLSEPNKNLAQLIERLVDKSHISIRPASG